MKIDPRLYCYFGARRTDEILEIVEDYSKEITINCSDSDRIMIKGFKLLLEIDGKDEVVITEDFKENSEKWIKVRNRK
jgi:hypothetical protein